MVLTMLKTRLIRRTAVAEGTVAFSFEKPEGFEFKAGQYLEMTLPEMAETDTGEATHSFSIASAPYEDEIMIATRMRDTPFKRVLGAMKHGAYADIEGPYGTFVLHNDAARPAVFLTGGIGITPFLSIIKQSTHSGSQHRVFLFYSNHTSDDAAFLVELQELALKNPNFTFVPTMTHGGKDWKGEAGRIDKAMLLRYLEDLARPVYYIAGPPEMVAAMAQMLEDAGVDPGSIKTEDFAGY
jgi:ferredoxin-NADP reductase